ncbi:RHS repeat-associated protein [Fontibacillus solani]|uniref:RHS repeat-associated protein n=1 Tax=Fontibacillus solani TaxID=1572857 RepID=A0A7W3SZI7_9BACL|nr:RHS repeat-associated core domain-containing protein [Fontibacillus solani]MBA9088808.1 RHS repeat-associated protein [Fontibacillus solani]
MDHTYDAIGRLLKVSNKKGTTVVSEYSYGYDANGNITSVTDSTGTTSYKYDSLNRLIQVKRPSGHTIDYTYDARGNRKTLNGDENFADPSGEQNYTFNIWDQLKTVTNGNTTTEFEYEMQGLRLSKTTTTVNSESGNGTTPTSVEKVRYVYNNGGKVISEANASNQVTANYVWGPDRLLAKRDVSTNKKYYYLYNGHGDVVQIIDESGNIVNNYQYDEWGNILQQQERIDNAFKYAGEIQDEETGLYYLRARYYDPEVGRFISKDTYEGQINNPLSLNLYTYVENNPSIYTDPTGYWCTATVNGKYYSHPGKCSGSGNGQDYIPDENATNFGRTIYDAGVSKGKWYPEGAFYIKRDKTGITDAIIGCANDKQCLGFVGGAVTEASATYNGVKSGVSKGINVVKGLVGNPSVKSVDDILKDATPGRVTKGKTTLYEKKGGYEQATKEFYSLNPSKVKDIETKYGPGKAGLLPDGRKITVRSGSTDGRVTIEIRSSNGRGIEIRYGK